MSEELLRVTATQPGHIDVDGEIDAHTAPKLDSVIFDTVALGHKAIVLDMSKVTFVDSSGLRVLIGHLNDLKHIEGSLRIESPSRAVEQLLEYSGLTDLLA